MADVHSKETRSYNMAQIRSKDTKAELLVRKYLFSRGLRYRKNDKRYPGRPDIVLPRYKTIVFVNSCFWHAHEGCPNFIIPKSKLEYWVPKLEGNRKRDAEHIAELQYNGWNVITVWECELKKAVRSERLERLYNEIIAQKNK
ncbi:MAG: very short patch repair endonuclease [Christensenellales bacterium]|jgi:DNA mismatch endonuclease (patch repair protein)|nr:DNA mismatch endonuclease Vsr [Christensenellaceae bacterium]